MGDGPAYDHAYSRAAQAAREREQEMVRRRGHLERMLSEVGFGSQSSALPLLEQEVARHLETAYELIRALTRGVDR